MRPFALASRVPPGTRPPLESRGRKIAHRLILAVLSLGVMASVIGLHSVFFAMGLSAEARLASLALLGLAALPLAFGVWVKLHRASLRTKLVASFLAVSLLPLTILAYLDQKVTLDTLTRNTRMALFSAAGQTASRLEAFIKTNLDTVRTESMLPEFSEFLSLPPGQRAGSQEQTRAMGILNSLKRRDRVNITSYALLDAEGLDVADTSGADFGLNKSQRDYFTAPMSAGLPYVSAVSLAGVTNRPSLYFSSPVRDNAGRILGVLRIRYNASILQRIIGRETGSIGTGTFAVLLDENHIRLADGLRPEYVMTPTTPLSQTLMDRLRRERRVTADIAPALLPDVEKVLAEASSQPFFEADLHDRNGEPTQNAVVGLESQPWLLVMAQPRLQFLEGVTEQARNAALLVVVIAVAVILAALFLAKRISEPVVRLTDAAGRLARGEQETPVLIRTGDELERLADSFNEMNGAIRDLVASLRRSHENLEAKVQERTQKLEEANERLLELDRLKSAFLSSASHELRTPLTSVLGFAKLCSKTFTRHFLPLSDREPLRHKAGVILENLGIIENEGERLTRLINDLLDLNKIESGKNQWRDEPIDVRSLLLRNAKAMSGQFAAKPEVAFSADIPEELPWVLADPDRIDQVLQNLLNNAAKFTKRGQVRLSARGLSSNWLEIRVADTGSGVARTDLDAIFEKFYQSGRENADREKPAGTGLGLAICRQIAEHYQGRIWAESIQGKGSVFVFQLPGRDPAAFPSAARRPPRP